MKLNQSESTNENIAHIDGKETNLIKRWQSIFLDIGTKKFLNFLDHCIETGTLMLQMPDGRIQIFKGQKPGPVAKIEVKNWAVAKKFLTGGSLGFAQSYINGDWDSPNLASLMELATCNREHLGKTIKGFGLRRLLPRIRHLLRANTREGSRRNISFHYDLGNDFYAAWLDPSMTYSSAIFSPDDHDLQSAQISKYRHLLDLLDVKPGDHILEIGCGWGGFAEIAAKERQAKVTGITLSMEQLRYARKRIANAGLKDQVRVQLLDYRDIEGHYDHIASIEMFEAVGEQYWPRFFNTLYDRLKPGGRAALQFISIEDQVFEAYRKSTDFIQSYIFPGGMLPSRQIFVELAIKNGFEWMGEKTFGQHYADTLRIWRQRFNTAFEMGQIPGGFDDHFKRVWNYYLAYCEGGFRAGGIDVQQVLLTKARTQY